MASLSWMVHRPTRTWHLVVGGLGVLAVSAGTRYLIKPEAHDAWAWGVVMGLASLAGGAVQLLRDHKVDDENRDNLPPYGGEWPPSN